MFDLLPQQMQFAVLPIDPTLTQQETVDFGADNYPRPPPPPPK